MATCPECEFDDIVLEDLEEGDTVSCPECGSLLVMTGADELDFADDDDDLDDDEDDEEDESDDLDEDGEPEDESEDEDFEE